MNQVLLEIGDISQRVAQRTLLHTCPETKQVGLQDELGRCAVTEQLVDPRLLVDCSILGQRVLRRLTVPCAVCGRVMLRDKAAVAQSGRFGHPEEIIPCTWTGWALLTDEVRTCMLTGAALSKTQAHGTGVSLAHADLLRDHQDLVSVDGELAGEARRLLEGQGHKVSRIWARKSPHRPIAAVVGECRSLCGLRRRYGIAFLDTAAKQILGKTALVGVRSGGWA